MTYSHPDFAVRQLSLRDYLRILKRRRLAVILTTLVVLVGAVVFSLQQQKLYRATVDVLISRQDLAAAVANTPQNPSLNEDPARYAATQASIARSAAVAQLALRRAGARNESSRTFLANSSVTPSSTADTLAFQVDNRNRGMAARLANAYASAFTTYKLQLDTASLQNARNQLLQQIAVLAKRGDIKSAHYQNLVASEQQLRTMQALQSQDTVLSHPTEGSQIQPQPKRDGLLGLGFGLLLGIAFAFALEALDRRIRTEEEIEEGLGLPVLARIPSPARRLRDRFVLTMLDDPRGGHADAVRRLATSILFASPDSPSQVLMVTSAVQREGKSTTVANLAVALARAGHAVALVDLDLRQPTLPSHFGVHRVKGLTDVAVGRATLDDALVKVGVSPANRGTGAEASGESLHLLPSGPLPASPGEFVGSEALEARVLAPLRQRFEYVLVDTPPICVVADASILATRVDAVVAVARLGLVQRPALRDLRRQLDASPATALGVAITGDDSGGAYGYSAYVASQPPSSNGRETLSAPGPQGTAPARKRDAPA